jgi:hypothetical protein
MKFSALVVASAFVAACSVDAAAAAFQSPSFDVSRRSNNGGILERRSSRCMSAPTLKEEEAPCAMPEDILLPVVTARSLRSAVLTNSNGEIVRLGDKMGKGTSVVVFLRHLG